MRTTCAASGGIYHAIAALHSAALAYIAGLTDREWDGGLTYIEWSVSAWRVELPCPVPVLEAAR